MTLHFEGHLLQALDSSIVRSFYRKLHENWKMVSEIFKVFYSFSRWHFPLEKWRLSCVATFVHAAHFYRTQWLYHNLELVEQFSRKLTICFHFIWKRWKRKQNFGKTDKLVFSRPPDWGSVRILLLSVAVCDFHWPNI